MGLPILNTSKREFARELKQLGQAIEDAAPFVRQLQESESEEIQEVLGKITLAQEFFDDHRMQSILEFKKVHKQLLKERNTLEVFKTEEFPCFVRDHIEDHGIVQFPIKLYGRSPEDKEAYSLKLRQIEELQEKLDQEDGLLSSISGDISRMRSQVEDAIDMMRLEIERQEEIRLNKARETEIQARYDVGEWLTTLSEQ